MKIHKIPSSKIKDYTDRNNKRVLKIISIALLIVAVIFYYYSKQINESVEFMWILTGSLIFTAIINWFSYLNNKKLTRLSAENLTITIDDESISRKIDLENETRMNFLHKIGYTMASGMSSAFYSKVTFDQLKSTELKKGDLWVKSNSANVLTGDNIVIVPAEIEGFKEIANFLKNKLE